VGFEKIFFHDAFDIPRMNGVEVEDAGDRNADRFLHS
jgi:hypothetical protein